MFMSSIVRAEIKDRVSGARAGKNTDLLCSMCALSNKISFYSSCIKEDRDKMHPYSWLFTPILLSLSSFQCLDASFNLCLHCLFLNILIPRIPFPHSWTQWDFFTAELYWVRSKRSECHIQWSPKLSSNFPAHLLQGFPTSFCFFNCDFNHFKHNYVLQNFGSTNWSAKHRNRQIVCIAPSSEANSVSSLLKRP